ncbi:MAG: CPBP family intramembrane metalloprotease [Bacilli bacterium]|nr:CPBP family intramembrane metalloprotease [Bacilli bacterium]
MKDKRNILKIACVLEIIYVILSVLYNILYAKSKEQVVAEIFINLIDIVFVIILYKESKKDEKILKKNKARLIISSIWFFISSIIPGILGFVYLSSLKSKKKNNLPLIKTKKIYTSDIVKAISLITSFLVIMFILPRYGFFKKIPSYLAYIIIFGLVILFNYRYLIDDFKIFKKNIKIYIPFIIKRYLYMLLTMIIVAIPIVLINKGDVSNNQKIINTMFGKLPFAMLLLSSFYAPFVEENIFRLSLSKIINNKYVFIVISGFIFGLLHVVGKSSSINEYIYVFQYSALGICLAKAYSDSNNIFVSISMHFIQNFLAAILVLLLF